MLPDPSQIRTEDERIDARNKCIAMYTAGGAAAGALAGALIGGSWKSAGVGALVGGGFGFLVAWGHCLSLYSTLQSQPVAGYQQTARQVGYNPSQGNVTKVQSFNVTPGSITPGQTVNLGGSYYVMAPEGAKEMKVTETRYVKYFDPSKNEWTNLGGVDQEITAAPGTAKGRRQIRHSQGRSRREVPHRVQGGLGGKEDTVERDLVVKKGTASLEYSLGIRRNPLTAIPTHGAVMMKRIPSTLVWLIVAVMALVPGAVMAQSTSVTDAHIQQINQQFAQNGVPNGFVALDSYGRLELKGDYEDEHAGRPGLFDRPDRRGRQVGVARHAGEHQGQGVGEESSARSSAGLRS